MKRTKTYHMKRIYNRKSITNRTVSALLTVSLAITGFNYSTVDAIAAENQTNITESSDESMAQYSNERVDNNYTKVSANYTYSEYTGDTIIYSAADIMSDGTATITDDVMGYDKDNKAVKAVINDTFTLKVDAPQDGIYYMSFDYLSADDSILPIEASVKINGEYSFYELRRQIFESLWVSSGEKTYDSYGKEITSIPDKKYEWQNKYIMDATYRYTEALGIELKKGANEVTFDISEGEVLIGNVYLSAKPDIKEYSGSEAAEGDGFVEIQAEDFTYRNDSSIHATCEYNPNLYPYNVKEKSLNTIDSSSFSEGGQTVTYEFEALSDGNYYMAFNYSQSDKSDFPVFMNIKIDGEYPNTEFHNYAFDYDKTYNMLTLKDENGDKLSVPLTKGTHTISLTISMEPVRHALEVVESVMNDVNDLALEITKVVGTNKDKYRDFSLEAYIPGVGDTLTQYADELDAVMEEAKQYNPGVKKIAAFSSLSIASGQLRSLAKDPDELLYRISELATSTNSVNKYLANLVDSLNGNDFSLDSIYFYQSDSASKLPKKVGFFKGIWLAIVRFFTSFTEQAYSTSNTDKEHLQVWVNRSRQHLEIMQQMIDKEFTPKTGIKVDLSLMPDQNKLVLANASGDSPDIATGINYSVPFELGIRGAIKDLSEFDDFAEVAERYNEGLLLASTIGDGIYAVPETMNFSVLYYRTDILEKLGLTVPDTLEDVKAMLPDLQMRGLNFYYPTARTTGTKTFLDTTPIIFQHGASLYGDTIADSAINSESVVEGFKELTDLFTIYNLPKDVPNFYQHFRNGDYPIGISDFGTYNLLSNAAPEIAGSWDIALIPGVVNDEGEVVRYSSAGAESTVMFKSDEERENMSWEFMKWWSSAEVQAEFGQTLQITYGDEYYWNTANMEAFAQLPWSTDDKEVIREQLDWTLEAPRVLASYMTERELSNAYNLVVISGENIRESLDSAARTIEKETDRKLEEFGYSDNKTVIKEYDVPTIEKVREIIESSKNGK